MATAKFVGYGGYQGDVQQAMDYLELGKVYEISQVVVGGMRTSLIIQGMKSGVTGKHIEFNHAMFDDCDWVDVYIKLGCGVYMV